MDDWKTTKKKVNRDIRYVLLWIAITVAFILLVNAAIWGINLLVSGPRGQGDGIVQRNSSQNWLEAQARFEENYAEIVATDRKITVAAEALAANPDDKTAQQTYTGTVNYCISVVADYNADARNFLREDFRAADLPDQIGTNNPTTDCKE